MLQLDAEFQPAEDKAIGRFVGIVRGPAGTGKSTLLGSASDAGHHILVADVENKGWGKYPRFAPPDAKDFRWWMDMILDILETPLESDGFVHLQIGDKTLKIDTLAIDTLDRLQELAMLHLGKPGRDARSWWGDLLELFKPLLAAIDYSPLNVIIINHVQEKTPSIQDSRSAEHKMLDAASKKSDDAVGIADLSIADFGIGIYDYADNALSGSLGRKINEHMHFILNIFRTPDGQSVLAATDSKINGVWYQAKDDFGLFKRENIDLEWHDTDAKILNDPLGRLWRATEGRDRLIQEQAVRELEPKTTDEEFFGLSDEDRNKAKSLVQEFAREFGLTKDTCIDLLDEWMDSLKDPRRHDTPDIHEEILLLLTEVVKEVWKETSRDLDVKGAGKIVAPVGKQLPNASSPKELMALAHEGLDLLSFEEEEAPEPATVEPEELEDVDEDEDDNLLLDEIPF